MWTLVFKDTLGDSLLLLPFLFLTYLLIEILEHGASIPIYNKIRAARRSGPVVGALLGMVPQCGFSAAAASLYSERVITVGTLMAVFLSTSDEMLPILVSETVEPMRIIGILLIKALIAAISGFLLNAWMRRRKRKRGVTREIWEREDEADCGDEECHAHSVLGREGVFLKHLRSIISHTLEIYAYIFIVTLALNVIMTAVGEDALGGSLLNRFLLGEVLSGLIGLIPNCASSVILVELYLHQVMGAGAVMTGLLVNGGVGLLVLFKKSGSRREALMVTGALYVTGVFWGIVIHLSGIVL